MKSQFKKLGKSAYLFEIEFDRLEKDKDLDFGYLIKDDENYPNVIFNLYNVFEVK